MENLIPLISEIQQVIRKTVIDIDINFPHIVVVGSQSTGKSSLLQSIIGRQFLPKGKGIVTRRPIQIELCKINSDKQYGEFVQNKGTYYHNMNDFKNKIQKQTERVCGNTKQISTIPLRIRYYSKNVLDMFLVDLPGITKNPIADQPKDIQQITFQMIMTYIKNPNSLIVAVSKATDDSANSQSLKIARYVDKQGTRTIGVLTQIDLVDKSINILKDYSVLSNKLALGYVPVYLRNSKSQASLSDQIDIQNQFFEKHPQYTQYADKMGVTYLKKLLNNLFIKQIQTQIPNIRQNILNMIEDSNYELQKYGVKQEVMDKKTKGILILSLVSKYVKYFKEQIQGRSMNLREYICGGARIDYIFSYIFIQSINKLDPFEYLSDDDIRMAIKNSNGLNKTLFLPELAFQNLLKTQIRRLKIPSLECAQLIYQELRRIIHEIKIPQIQRYENFKKRIIEVMQNLLLECEQKAEQMIKNLINIQLGYINTNHPDFIDIISLIEKQPKRDLFREQQIQISSVQQQFNDNIIQPSHSLVKIKKTNRFQRNQLINQSQRLDIKLCKMNQNKWEQDTDKKYYNEVQETSSTRFQYINYNSQYNDNLPHYRLPNVPSIIKLSKKSNQKQKTQLKMIKNLIKSYFDVVKKNINDSVPKTIITMLVQFSKVQSQKILVNNLYVESQFDYLLQDKGQISQKRQSLQNQLLNLRRCLGLITQIQLQLKR